MKKGEANTARRKAMAKDVSTNKKISSFFTKKSSSESISVTNSAPVKDVNEKNDFNNSKRKINEPEDDSLEHYPKLRKVESHNVVCSKTSLKSKQKSERDFGDSSKSFNKATPMGAKTFEVSGSSNKNILSLISPEEKTVESTNLESGFDYKNVLKEKVFKDIDSGFTSKSSSLEENLNSNYSNETLDEKTFEKQIFDEVNKENSLNATKLNVDEELTRDNLQDLLASDLDGEIGDFFDDNWNEFTERSQLDLSEIKRCEVLNVVRSGKDVILTLKSSNSKDKASVKCSDYWVNAELEIGQDVMIKALKINDDWVIDNNNGILVTHPDMLISGTSVVGALFCNRRCILKEKFRGIESLPQVESDGSYMAVGLLVHNILEKTLELKLEKLAEIEEIYEEVIQSFDAISLMYQCGMSIQDCRSKVQPYIPQIYNFIQRYIKGIKQPTKDENFEGQIDAIRDIEENIWLPKLGLKGKVDVSVEVKIHSRRKIMPLELKTGKSSFSPEHKGQVILYTMMMSLIGQQVDSGLLLYLKENDIKEVKSSHNEQRDLLMLRNTLAHYLANKSNVNLENFNDVKELLLDLPEPINHRNACETCPVNHLCSMYLVHDETFRLRDSSHPLKSLSEKLLSHLKPDHINYVMKWVKMQQIEEEANSANSSMKDLWTLEPIQRERKGVCICNLTVIQVQEKGKRYLHVFRKIKNLESAISDFNYSGINENDYVVINTKERINIVSGYVIDMRHDSLTVLLERNITLRYPGMAFHVDKYFSLNISNYNRAAVSGLLTNDEVSSRLRNIVIEKQPATFKSHLRRTIAPISAPILKRLNSQQQRAILKVLTAREYVLLKGMPGTGKTRTLVALIELLVKLGKSVLVTANTHSAVDNILMGLIERNIDFLRLGSQARIHPLLSNYSEEAVTAQCKSPESLREVYTSKSVVGVTCLGSYHKLFENRKFDMCLVDESTQVQQSTVLKPLYSAAKFVLVGDPEQLPPIAKSETARKLGFNESLFMRLDSENNTIVLFAQYRMNREIMNLANKLTYKNQLEVGSESVGNATIFINIMEFLQSCDWWIQAALSAKLEDSVVFLNTSVPENFEFKIEYVQKGEKMYCNRMEVAIVQRLVNTLLKIGLKSKDVGIIAPFRAQVSLLGKAVPADVEVNTVDQYQGREKNIIIYSCTETSPQGYVNTRAFHILDDLNRLTVAITRARHKLIIIGDKNILKSYSPFEKLLQIIQKEKIVDLFNSKQAFDLPEVINYVKCKSEL